MGYEKNKSKMIWKLFKKSFKKLKSELVWKYLFNTEK